MTDPLRRHQKSVSCLGWDQSIPDTRHLSHPHRWTPSYDRLISTTWFPILARQHFILNQHPGSFESFFIRQYMDDSRHWAWARHICTFQVNNRMYMLHRIIDDRDSKNIVSFYLLLISDTVIVMEIPWYANLCTDNYIPRIRMIWFHVEPVHHWSLSPPPPFV